jgi:hypothetical protein
MDTMREEYDYANLHLLVNLRFGLGEMRWVGIVGSTYPNLAICFKSRRTPTEGSEKKDVIELIKSIRYFACLPYV